MVTIGIALMLVLGALLLTGDDRKDRFAQGKEVLTILVGIFGTILGFYFGSEKSSKNTEPSLEVAPVLVARAPDGRLVSVGTSITGGRPPYTFSIALKDGSSLLKDGKQQMAE